MRVVKNKMQHKYSTISILIPCFNLERYIGETLDSIARQIDSGVEVICYDDGSSDNTSMILRKYEWVRSITSSVNNGVGHARNALIKEASGDYLWFIDGDDILIDGSYEKIRKIINSQSPECISFDYSSFGGKHGKEANNDVRTSFIGASKVILEDKEKNYIGTLDSKNYHPWSRIFHRSLYSEDIRFSGVIFEDVEIIPILVLKARSHYHFSEVFLKYRVHDGSILGRTPPESIIFLLEALSKQRARIERDLGGMTTAMRDAHVAACARSFRSAMKKLNAVMPHIKDEFCTVLYETFRNSHGLTLFELTRSLLRKNGVSFTMHTIKRYLQCKYKL